MGEDCRTWIPELHLDCQSSILRSFNAAPFDMGKLSGTSAAMNPGANMVPRNVAMPAYASSARPHSQIGHSGDPNGWFYCLPRFRQGFAMPARNFNEEDKLPAGHAKGFREEIAPNGQSGFPQKQFMIIDQTTLVYSSRVGGNVEFPASSNSKLHVPNNLNYGNQLLSGRRDVNHLVGLGPTLDDKVDENQETDDDIESEMHEDTEEINALLYSDSDGYSTEDGDDDEVTSTGHSPSTMTTHDNQEEALRGTAEEVASSIGQTKKRKLRDGAYDDDMQLMDTASSLNGKRPFEVGNGSNDAESRCFSGGNISRGSGEMGSLSGNKNMRKEKLQDVLSILQRIVPGGKDKDPIELLDEAIRCLKSLKLKAIELGLDAI